MKIYGKEPESLDHITELFIETLAGYSWNDINAAMTEHTRENVEFPTPADIIQRINKKNEARAGENRPERQIFVSKNERLPRVDRLELAEKLRIHRESMRKGTL